MDEYVWISVCSWMGGQGGDLISGIFEAVPECPEDFPFSILVQRPHKELGMQKPARLEEKDKGHHSVGLQSS